MTTTKDPMTDSEKFDLSGAVALLGLIVMVLGIAFSTVFVVGGLIAAGLAFLAFLGGVYGMGRYFGL